MFPSSLTPWEFSVGCSVNADDRGQRVSWTPRQMSAVHSVQQGREKGLRR